LLLNSLTPLLIFLIAAVLFNDRIATIAGYFAAFSPQFAYHSAIILPDELSVLPILAAVYFLFRSWEDHRLEMALLCGFCIGLSCWLRSNAMLLPVFFILSLLFAFPKNWRIIPAAVVLGAFVLTIAPITIRNYVVFKTLVPISVGLGTTFVEGLGDADQEGNKGMPVTDEDVMKMDAAHFARPDYYGNLYAADGIERERNRIITGLADVAADPIWYLKAVLDRSMMTWRMERVPVIDSNHKSDATNAILLYLNIPLKLLQRFFITAIFLPFVLLGLVMLISKKQRGKLAILAPVPIYFMTVQPLIHTEYRYLHAATHVLIIFAAVGLSELIGWIQKLNFQISNQ